MLPYKALNCKLSDFSYDACGSICSVISCTVSMQLAYYYILRINGIPRILLTIGKMTIDFEKLPECQEYDSWHQLMPLTKATSKGTLRLAAIFNVSSCFIII